MKIDGKAIAEQILNKLTHELTDRKVKGRVPTLAVILVGDNPASLAYIKQKQKAAEGIGAKLVLSAESLEFSKNQLRKLILKYNNDHSVHGLIIQRPLPKELGNVVDILNSVKPEKDVDGFLPNSPFSVPVSLAVQEILRTTHVQNLQQKRIVVVGRGETAGKPIADFFMNQKCKVIVIHSQTPNPKDVIRKADIIISCVGKERVVTKDMIKPRSILIGVGIWRDSAGKLHGDYEENEIKDIASYYTPTPGGVGPVNVACLMQNLVKACSVSLR